MFVLSAVGLIIAITAMYMMCYAIHKFLANQLNGESMAGIFLMTVILLGASIGFFAISTHGFDNAIMHPDARFMPPVEK